MDDPLAARSHPWRPRIRLTVRVLMVLVLVLGGGGAWVVHRARVQREAVAAIDRARGSVEYDDTFLARDSANAPHQPGWKEWLVNHVGIDYFEAAQGVHFENHALSSRLGSPFGFTTTITAQNVPADDDAALHAERITDAGLLQLATLTNCLAVSVKGTNVTENGVASLQRILPATSIEH